MGSVSYLQATRPDTGKITKLIEGSLLHDWIIRIEYQSNSSATVCWKQWDESFFALNKAKDVITALKACYTKNPHCTIRINAEKVWPQTRMLYTAYIPRVVHADSLLPQLANDRDYATNEINRSNTLT